MQNVDLDSFPVQSSLKGSDVKQPIYLNIYNFYSCMNKCLGCLNIGVYHTGIEIFNDEYMYQGHDDEDTGVIYIEPRSAAYEFADQILLGYTDKSYGQIDREILEPLRAEFLGSKYDLLEFNCNNFSYRFAQQLKVSNKFPQKIMSITSCINSLRCCIPQCILNGRLEWFDFSEQDTSLQEPFRLSRLPSSNRQYQNDSLMLSRSLN